MIRNTIGIVGAFIVLIAFSSPRGEDSLDPKLDLLPGEYYVCAMDLSKRIEQTIEGEKQIMEQNLLQVWDYKILSENNDGNYEISATYSRIKTSQRFGMQTVEFDSDNMGDYVDPGMIGYKHMVGSELRLEVTPEGKLERLDGFQEIIDKIINELNIPDSPQRSEIIKGIREQFGDDAMRESFEQMTSFYPDRPVDTGATWYNTYNMNVGFPIIVESDYTLRSRQDGIADIDVVSRIRSDPKSEEIDMGQFSLTYNIEGSQNGVIKIDENSGLPIRSDIQQSFSGTVSVSEAPDLEEKSWPISADGRVIITFEKQ